MKNTKHPLSSSTKRHNIIVTLIGKNTAVLLGLFFMINTCAGQDGLPPHKTLVGVSLRTEICADGYGGKYQPGFFISKGREYCSLNAVLQTRNSNLAGFQLSYNYALTGEPVNCDKSEPELYLAVSAAYHYKGMLGKRALRDERMANPSASEFDIDNMCFKSVEIFVGVGLKLELFRNLKWANSIGVGGYTSLYTPVKNLYYESSALGLRLSSGLSYAFN